MSQEFDLVARMRQVSDQIAKLQEEVAELSSERLGLMEQLIEQGWSRRQLADQLEVTPTRIGQILTSGIRQERSLLGRGPLTVAVGGKWEEGRSNPSMVISREALDAYHMIVDTAGSYGLSVNYQLVPYKTRAHLSRPNLIVIGSPRLIINLREALESDPCIRFATDGNDRWYLIERREDMWVSHYSPADAGTCDVDLAYIGRLPRPDGKGTFLYLAGIHACGTKGAASYLTHHIAELYSQVRNKMWSAIVRTEYDRDTRDVISTELASPIYTRDE